MYLVNFEPFYNIWDEHLRNQEPDGLELIEFTGIGEASKNCVDVVYSRMSWWTYHSRWVLTEGLRDQAIGGGLRS